MSLNFTPEGLLHPVGHFNFYVFAALCLHPSVLQPRPPPAIFQLLLQTKAVAPIDPWASLAWRLGGPWVAQAWPKGHPIPDPIPTHQAEGRKHLPALPSHAFSMPVLDRFHSQIIGLPENLPYPSPYPLCTPNFTQGHPSHPKSAEGRNALRGLTAECRWLNAKFSKINVINP
jgi:hypothetical protein